jgi:hypothetical protein
MRFIGLVVFVGVTLAGVVPAALAADPVGTIDPIDELDGATKTLKRPIIFVHGYEKGSAWNCNGWDGMKSLFRNQEPKAPNSTALVTIGYYKGDTNCSQRISGVGSHSKHYGHSGTSHDTDTDIRHLAYHLAWYIESVWTRYGDPVDIVAHSMGGLIVRYMVAQVVKGNADFPSDLRIHDIVTLGTPHNGYRAISALGCSLISPSTQCKQMNGTSSFMDWLRANAMSPETSARTDWTTLGSDDDSWVAADSATGMGTNTTKVWYFTEANIEHGDFINGPGLNTGMTAHIQVKKQFASSWNEINDGRFPGRWTQRALYYNDL